MGAAARSGLTRVHPTVVDRRLAAPPKGNAGSIDLIPDWFTGGDMLLTIKNRFDHPCGVPPVRKPQSQARGMRVAPRPAPHRCESASDCGGSEVRRHFAIPECHTLHHLTVLCRNGVRLDWLKPVLPLDDSRMRWFMSLLPGASFPGKKTPAARRFTQRPGHK